MPIPVWIFPFGQLRNNSGAQPCAQRLGGDHRDERQLVDFDKGMYRSEPAQWSAIACPTLSVPGMSSVIHHAHQSEQRRRRRKGTDAQRVKKVRKETDTCLTGRRQTLPRIPCERASHDGEKHQGRSAESQAKPVEGVCHGRRCVSRSTILPLSNVKTIFPPIPVVLSWNTSKRLS